MLKKTISYEDFNGKKIDRVCYFHLSKSELVELEMSRKGGLQAWIQHIIDSEDGKALIEEFKNLILASYGKRTEDGSGFTKSDELRWEFERTQAYDALFMELVTNAEKAAEFVNGIVPNNFEKEIAALTGSTSADDEAKRVRELGDEQKTDNVFETSQPRVLTQAEIIEMDADELKSGLATGKYLIQ